MTDYTDLIARLRNGSDGSPEAEAADAIEALLSATDSMGVAEFFEQSRRDAAAITALTAERDALREAIINRLHHYDEATGEDRCGCGACEPLFAALTATTTAY